MLNLVSNEILKLRTVRTPWIVLGVQQLLIVAGMSGMAVASLDFQAPDAARVMITHAGLSSLFMLVLGILAVSGEYRDGTITDTLLATPNCARVIAAKVITYTGLGLTSGLISALTATITTIVWFSAKGASLDLGSPDVLRTLAGVVLWMPLYAALGVGLGTLIPNPGGAITIAFAWIALVEGIMINLLGDLGRWLPMASGMALDYVPRQSNLLPQVTGGLVLAGYAAAFVIAATISISRRDVS